MVKIRAKPIKTVCAYCNAEFLNKGTYLRLCCDRSCATKYRMKKAGDRMPWTDAEIDLLEKISGNYPSQEITKKYNGFCKRLGYPQRSENGVLNRLKRIGASQVATEDNWKMSTLAELLGVSRDKVRNWVSGRYQRGERPGGLLPCRRLSNITAISKKDFKKFASEYPEKLKGIHPENLLFVLGDRALVRKITTAGRPTTGYRHRIMNCQTGEIFESARQAGEKLFMNGKHILRQTKAGKKAYGVEFKILAIAGAG